MSIIRQVVTLLIPTCEVAKRLEVSPRTVARMAADGRLTAVQQLHGLRGALLFDPADVEELRHEKQS